MLALASLAFVGTHFLMSHPLRAPMVAALGERGFAIAYTIVSLLTFGWMIWAYPEASAEAPQPLWDAGRWGYVLATLLMWLGSVLFMGSLRRNPAFPRPGRRIERIDEPRGVFSITRHPMMWGFALWAAAHILVAPTGRTIVLAGAIGILALAGAALQDGKKRKLLGDGWRRWEEQTSYWPRLGRLGGAGWKLWLGAVVAFLLFTWLHIPLAYVPAGPWRWFG